MKWLRKLGAKDMLRQIERLDRKLADAAEPARFCRLFAQREALIFATLYALPDWVGDWAFEEAVSESHSGDRRRVAEVAATFADPESGAPDTVA
jgi:hypothetical protein